MRAYERLLGQYRADPDAARKLIRAGESPVDETTDAAIYPVVTGRRWSLRGERRTYLRLSDASTARDPVAGKLKGGARAASGGRRGRR